jgi:hypothetical protein
MPEPGSVIPALVDSALANTDAPTHESEEFSQIVTTDAVRVIKDIVNRPMPRAWATLQRRTAIIAEVQATARTAWGLDAKGGPLTVNLAFLGQSVVEPKRISERIMPSQVVDVEASPSDSHADAFDPGI